MVGRPPGRRGRSEPLEGATLAATITFVGIAVRKYYCGLCGMEPGELEDRIEILVVETIATEVGILYEGQLVESGAPEDLLERLEAGNDPTLGTCSST